MNRWEAEDLRARLCREWGDGYEITVTTSVKTGSAVLTVEAERPPGRDALKSLRGYRFAVDRRASGAIVTVEGGR